jgi:hypothetical protein
MWLWIRHKIVFELKYTMLLKLHRAVHQSSIHITSHHKLMDSENHNCKTVNSLYLLISIWAVCGIIQDLYCTHNVKVRYKGPTMYAYLRPKPSPWVCSWQSTLPFHSYSFPILSVSLTQEQVFSYLISVMLRHTPHLFTAERGRMNMTRWTVLSERKLQKVTARNQTGLIMFI